MEGPKAIIHHFSLFYYLVLVIPILLCIGLLIISFAYFDRDIDYLPFISDIVMYYPEKKILSISMTLELFSVLFLILMRNWVFKIIKRGVSKISNTKFGIIRGFMLLFGGLACFGGIMFSTFSDSNSNSFHMFSHHVFFVFFFCYIYLNDYLSKKLGYPCRDASKGLSIAYSCSSFSFLIFRYYLNDGSDDTKYTTASLLGYIAFLTLFIKMYIIKNDIPTFGIRVTKI